MWQRMIANCYDAKSTSYHLYGAQGVAVCRRWRESAGTFVADVGERPTPRHRLELLNKKRGFRPGNVRWVTAKEQRLHRRTTTLIEHDGMQRTIAQWCEHLGISHQAMAQRLAKCRELGAHLAEAVATPAGERMPCMARKMAARRRG